MAENPARTSELQLLQKLTESLGSLTKMSATIELLQDEIASTHTKIDNLASRFDLLAERTHMRQLDDVRPSTEHAIRLTTIEREKDKGDTSRHGTMAIVVTVIGICLSFLLATASLLIQIFSKASGKP